MIESAPFPIPQDLAMNEMSGRQYGAYVAILLHGSSDGSNVRPS
jgi:hypothetical protein